MNFCSLLSDKVPAPFLLNFCHWHSSWLVGAVWTPESAKQTFCLLANIPKLEKVYLNSDQFYMETEINIRFHNVTFTTRDYRVCDICISMAQALNYSLTMFTDKFQVEKCSLNCYETPLLTFDSEIFKRKYFFNNISISANDDTTIDIMNVLLAEEIFPQPNLILNSSK